MKQPFSALLPIAVVGALVCGWGTFYGSASATGALGHQALVLAFCLLTPTVRDPLGLGSAGRWLLPALVAVAVVSVSTSPVARAGRVGLILLPAYLLIPAATSWCCRQTAARRTAVDALALLTLIVGVYSLVSWHSRSLERAALPLGHHNLLAGWLVLVLPLTLIGLSAAGRRRWLAAGAGLVAACALLATGSRLGLLAVAAQALLACLFWQRLRPWLLTGALLLMVIPLPRLQGIGDLADPSAAARLSYLEAGWRGLVERPALGWGPGSVPWTIGTFLQPRAEIHPAGQIVGDLHSLPAQMAYEIGISGALLALAAAAVFFRRRTVESRLPSATIDRQAALLGLSGGAVFALGAAPLTIPALPVTAAVVAGLTLPQPRSLVRRSARPALLAYAVLAAALLLPLDRAHFAYDRARTAQVGETRRLAIERARLLDPGFPLYRARWAWLTSDSTDRSQAADQARQAAVMAPGLAPLWLAAGELGLRAGSVWAPQALRRAHQLDPLSPLVTFQRMRGTTDPEEAARLGSQAVAAEPRLAAADWWRDHPEIAARVAQDLALPVPDESDTAGFLALTLDRRAATSFSLYAFRRRPWLGHLAPVSVGTESLASEHTSVP